MAADAAPGSRPARQNGDAPEIREYLTRLSRRVRGLRARRGMTRKDLSWHSGISERYLAQLENGEANPSIALLWRIAIAMDVDFADLFGEARERGPEGYPPLWQLLEQLDEAGQQQAYTLLAQYFGSREGHAQGIALIGLRGAGKTTLGKRLAAAFGVPFVRLGTLIEELGGIGLSELFSLGGQKAYRRLERQALERAIAEHPLCVLETGGSMVSEPGTFERLRERFYTVWLTARPEEHMERVIAQGDFRPMQGNDEAMEDLRRILAEREPFYRRADAALDTSGRSIEASLADLVEIARPCLEQDDQPARRLRR
ncbi:MAG TPA: helix-turn-helix transcriptional regulator [Gammaproteobacteria bacterium]|nr:helix-turn-helix transcriptional regulator [Gammaproteobacteria bacterium]